MRMYRKTALQPMEPWAEGMDLTAVSISDYDLENGSPKKGDMIAYGDEGDMWLVAKNFFEANHRITTR